METFPALGLVSFQVSILRLLVVDLSVSTAMAVCFLLLCPRKEQEEKESKKESREIHQGLSRDVLLLFLLPGRFRRISEENEDSITP